MKHFCVTVSVFACCICTNKLLHHTSIAKALHAEGISVSGRRVEHRGALVADDRQRVSRRSSRSRQERTTKQQRKSFKSSQTIVGTNFHVIVQPFPFYHFRVYCHLLLRFRASVLVCCFRSIVSLLLYCCFELTVQRRQNVNFLMTHTVHVHVCTSYTQVYVCCVQPSLPTCSTVIVNPMNIYTCSAVIISPMNIITCRGIGTVYIHTCTYTPVPTQPLQVTIFIGLTITVGQQGGLYTTNIHVHYTSKIALMELDHPVLLWYPCHVHVHYI